MPQLEIANYLSQTTAIIFIYILYYIAMKKITLASILEKIFLKNKILFTHKAPTPSSKASTSHKYLY